MSDDPWYTSPAPCPVCGDHFNALASGVVERGHESQLEGPIARLCMIGPDDDHEYTTLYLHPEALVGDEGDDDE